MKQYLLTSLFLASAALGWAVPAQINYQGRLTDANGDPVTGEVSMSLKMFDAATAGNELYSEDLGTVTLDDNGVYSFQFGASGQSVVDREETIAITDGSSTSFSNTLGSVPLDETLVVADGTYSWNVVDGNPGEQATATAVLANGFVVGVTVTNGGEGYVEPPAVTIEGLGSGATATAVVENGAITAINVDATGSGYASATVTIAEPPAPYVVNYDAGTVSVTYEAAPSAGTEILATYEANDRSIVGVLGAADSHWLELSVDGVAQSPRERVLSVPFALNAMYANQSDISSNILGFNIHELRELVYDLYESQSVKNIGNAYTIASRDYIDTDWTDSITFGSQGDLSGVIYTPLSRNIAENVYLVSLSAQWTFYRGWGDLEVIYADGTQIYLNVGSLPENPSNTSQRLWSNPKPETLISEVNLVATSNTGGYGSTCIYEMTPVIGPYLDWNFTLPDNYEGRFRVRSSWSGNWPWVLYQVVDDQLLEITNSAKENAPSIDRQFEKISGSEMRIRVIQTPGVEKNLNFGQMSFYRE